jgi:magnesium chelatase family protein
LEVVLAGGHKVVIISTIRSPASDLLRAAANIAKANGIAFSGTVIPVCPCGAFGSPKAECSCSMAELKAHARKITPMMKAADIVIETVEPLDGDTTRAGENEDRIVARILDARKGLRPDPGVLASDAEDLLRMAIREYGTARDKTALVAATIARLGGCARIEVNHIAEAVQYQHPALTRWFDDFEEGKA